MTVKEVIEFLKKCDQELSVHIGYRQNDIPVIRPNPVGAIAQMTPHYLGKKAVVIWEAG